MPITLGILAQSRQAPVAAGSYDLLETYVVPSGGVASVSFSNLNTSYGSTYKHLQIRATWRGTRSTADDDLLVTFNGDTAANYSWHYLGTLNGSTVVSSGQANQGSMIIGTGVGGNGTANGFNGQVIDILDPFVTTKNKTIRGLGGFAGSVNRVTLFSGAWRNNNAVSSITLFSYGNAAEFSRFSLYGVK